MTALPRKDFRIRAGGNETISGKQASADCTGRSVRNVTGQPTLEVATPIAANRSTVIRSRTAEANEWACNRRISSRARGDQPRIDLAKPLPVPIPNSKSGRVSRWIETRSVSTPHCCAAVPREFARGSSRFEPPTTTRSASAFVRSTLSSTRPIGPAVDGLKSLTGHVNEFGRAEMISHRMSNGLGDEPIADVLGAHRIVMMHDQGRNPADRRTAIDESELEFDFVSST